MAAKMVSDAVELAAASSILFRYVRLNLTILFKVGGEPRGCACEIIQTFKRGQENV